MNTSFADVGKKFDLTKTDDILKSMKLLLIIFFGQALNHMIWYVGMRAAVAQNIPLTIMLDSAYAVLMVMVLKKMETSRFAEWVALLLGGAIGTYAGLTIGV